jgi:hypothetical protein
MYLAEVMTITDFFQQFLRKVIQENLTKIARGHLKISNTHKMTTIAAL